MFRLLVFVLFFCCTTFVAFSQRARYNFNTEWKVYAGDTTGAEQLLFNDVAWKAVTLPYAWNQAEAFRKDISELSTGISWYRKRFTIPPARRGKKYFVEFEGIRQAGDFYINGKHIGIHENGVTAFGFDITPFINPAGENVIAARIDNSWDYKEKATQQKFQWEDKNFNVNYGGINKNVYLHVSGDVYQTLPLFSKLGTTGVYVYAKDHNIKQKTISLHAESEIINESHQPEEIQYEVTVTDEKGRLVKVFQGEKKFVAAGQKATLKATSLLRDVNFWSWGYGYLYKIKTILKINGKVADEVITRTGFRKTNFESGMIYLNDRVIMVHGYAQRTTNEWPSVGISVPAWLSDYSNALMVKSNGNLVRWMHVTPSKQDIESCDRVGLMQAMPAGDAESDVTGVRWQQRKAVMQDAIIYNRNNPSIVFYECGNENISESNMREMTQIRDLYDPNGGRAIGSREMLDSRVAEYGGEMLYVNKSAHIPMWAMEYSRDEGSRKYWDDHTPPYHKDGAGPLYKNQDASAYNRNMESHAVENVKRWYDFWHERPGTGKRVSAGGVNIIFSETNTHHRGEENYRRSGEVDALRIPKENFYAHQVMWNGWVNPEKHGIHIVGHWNYRPGVKKSVYVISTAEKVELKINGKSAGFGHKSDGFLFTFPGIEWESGVISAVGYDDKNVLICSSQKATAGAPVRLRLSTITNPAGAVADGADLALVQVEVVDAAGNRVPDALNMIQFSIDGPADWIGGMAMGPGNYTLTKSFPVENGVNRALVRMTNKAGIIRVKASSEGLKDASITFQSKPVNTGKGLSTALPGNDLPSNLERGPTPGSPSFKMLRNTLEIAGVTAGSNTGMAQLSIDDNEMTDWVNDGKISSAWIEYDLKQEAVLTEVVLKLNNFRSKVYPLRITVDGQEVFNGPSARSLGYITIPCKPVKGKKVRIQLTDDTKEGESKMVEVTGKKLDDGVKRDDAQASGLLSIIEAELYGK